MQELPGSTAHLPNTFVRTPPIVPQPLQQTLNILPFRMGDGLAVLIGEINGIHHLAINIELELRVGSVTDPNRPRIFVTAKLIQRDLFEILPAVYAVHDLQWASLSIIAQTALQPLDKGLCFVD